ncbi:MAG: thioredoxin family protein [Planctomycetota bacterium]|jgi:thiol-disulfide isomerase/thioredoxin
MAPTLSTMLPLGTVAPAFSLYEPLTDKVLSLRELASPKGTLVAFICNHCPYVKHIREGLVQLGRDYIKRDVGIVAINSNDVQEYPDDRPEEMVRLARTFDFPFLFDDDQSVARAFHAACTPDFFLFDGERRLVYRGQFDDSRPDNHLPVTGESVRQALEALLAGEGTVPNQKPSMGCNIKWKKDTPGADTPGGTSA